MRVRFMPDLQPPIGHDAGLMQLIAGKPHAGVLAKAGLFTLDADWRDSIVG